MKNSAKKTMEAQSVRELFINIGKILGVLLLIAMYKEGKMLTALYVVNAALVLTWIFYSFIGEKRVVIRRESVVSAADAESDNAEIEIVSGEEFETTEDAEAEENSENADLEKETETEENAD